MARDVPRLGERHATLFNLMAESRHFAQQRPILRPFCHIAPIARQNSGTAKSATALLATKGPWSF
jgi:hypothetical protein